MNVNSTLIYNQLEHCCVIAQDVKGPLLNVINKYSSIADSQFSKSAMKAFFQALRRQFGETDGVDWNETKILYKCCFVLLLTARNPSLLFNSYSQLLAHYPEFAEVDAVELAQLLQYRNMMHVAAQLTISKNHKGEFLIVAGRLCGTVSITGSGQTKATSRRVLIYEREGGLVPFPTQSPPLLPLPALSNVVVQQLAEHQGQGGGAAATQDDSPPTTIGSRRSSNSRSSRSSRYSSACSFAASSTSSAAKSAAPSVAASTASTGSRRSKRQRRSRSGSAGAGSY